MHEECGYGGWRVAGDPGLRDVRPGGPGQGPGPPGAGVAGPSQFALPPAPCRWTQPCEVSQRAMPRGVAVVLPSCVAVGRGCHPGRRQGGPGARVPEAGDQGAQVARPGVTTGPCAAGGVLAAGRASRGCGEGRCAR